MTSSCDWSPTARSPLGPRDALAAVTALTAAVAMRLAREGMLLRAVAWPGLLVSIALVGSAAAVGALTRSPGITVADIALVAPLESSGFVVDLVADPSGELSRGVATRAAWQEGDQWVLASLVGGRDTLRAESVLRRHVGQTWQIEIAPPPARSLAVEGHARLLAALVCVLFALYGVVIGAGLVVRDRDDGVLEVEMALPVPGWMHGAARMVACGGALVAFQAATLWLVDGLLGIPAIEQWTVHGAAAALSGLSVGMLAATGARGSVAFRQAPLQKEDTLLRRLAARTLPPSSGEGLSAPLSWGLTLSTGAMAIGWAAPAVGGWLPLSSVTALASTGDAPLAPLLGAAALATVAAARFGRDEWSR